MREYTQTQTLDWQGISIRINYCPNYSPAFQNCYGHPLAHLELHSPEPLPVTETGYRSHFIDVHAITDLGGPCAYVLAWLDELALSPEWQAYKAKTAQMSLF